MKTYRGKGERVNWTNGTGSLVASGALVLFGANRAAIACADIAAGAVGAVALSDEHEVAATAAETWAAGDVLYLVDGTHELSNVTGDAVAGHATKAKAPTATTGCVKLEAGVLTAPADKAVTVAKLADAVQDDLPTATVTAGAEGAHARTITVQLKDAAGNNLAEQRMVRMTVNPTSALAPPAATGTDTFGAPSAGTIQQTVVAKADYWVMTDAAGKYVFALTHNDAGSSRWIAACAGSKAVSSAEITFDAV